MSIAGRVLVALAGVGVVLATFGSALRTVVLPRGVPARLSQAVFRVTRVWFGIRLGRAPSYERRDAVMASFAPVSLIVLLFVWLALVLAGFAGVFWATADISPDDALLVSGSSLLTLGIYGPPHQAGAVIVFFEAAVGLVLLALLITYLPSLYGAFSRREAQVAKLEVRAGRPPSAVTMLERFWVLGRLDALQPLWSEWEDWFVEVEESHTSFPALTYFRSPQAHQSWVTAAGAVLDAASLRTSLLDAPRSVEAELCLRAGYLCLRRIALFFELPHDAEPHRGDPISVTREEFVEAYEQLAGAGLPMRADRQAAWEDFAGWRVNYDTVLIGLAAVTAAPYAPWSSDRSAVRLPRRTVRA